MQWRGPVRIDHWKDLKIYARMQEKNKAANRSCCTMVRLLRTEAFTRRNGIEQILKDRFFDSNLPADSGHYVPGWDCHGLPIEHKVTKACERRRKILTVWFCVRHAKIFPILISRPAKTIPTAWGSCRLGKRISYHERSLRGGDSQNLRVLR